MCLIVHNLVVWVWYYSYCWVFLLRYLLSLAVVPMVVMFCRAVFLSSFVVVAAAVASVVAFFCFLLFRGDCSWLFVPNLPF